MTDILISHVDQDVDRVRELVRRLADLPWSVWWNEKIPPGAAIDLVTESQLETAKVIITLWSEASVKSMLVRNTAHVAMDEGRWLPVRLDAVKVPLRFLDYQTIDLIQWPEVPNEIAEGVLFESTKSFLDSKQGAKQGMQLPRPKRSTPSPGSGQRALVASSATVNGEETSSTNVVSVTNGKIFLSVQLGQWRVEEGQNRISCGDRVKRITPRSMQVLVLLLENGQAPVSIGHILSHVWSDRVVVESVVHRCISELREALEDNFRHPSYIETIAKRGYRIIAPIVTNKED